METKKQLGHGLQLTPIVIGKDYVLGSYGSLGGDVLQPTGQWDVDLPEDEVQNLNGIEPYACTLFALLNCVETLIKLQFGEDRNYSDRWLAKATGTDSKLGNDPQYVAEYLRAHGVVAQTDWGFDNWVDTFAKFYAPLPAALYSIAVEFIAEFEFKHEYVPTDAASLKQALTYSPLAVGLYAWQQNFEQYPEGYYFTPPGVQPNHCVMLYGYEPGQYWKVFDSYDQTHKKLVWDFPFAVAKRFKLTRQTNTTSKGWYDFLSILWVWWPFGQKPIPPPVAPTSPVATTSSPTPAPAPPPAPVPVKTVALGDFCLAIRGYEGWNPGSRSFKNNNPGNCRYSTVGYTAVYKPVLKDPQNFAVFKDYATGWLYLRNLVKERIAAHPEWSLKDFFAVYAPASDDNDPVAYAAAVAKQLGVDSDFLIKNISA